MTPYQKLMKRIVDEGKWVVNERTGKRCLTVINADLEYDCSKGELPLDTTRKSYWRSAVAEMMGYLRGYDSAAQFRAIGCNTWDANANENQAWLDNTNRSGTDDMGRVYGVQAREWLTYRTRDKMVREYDMGEMVTELKSVSAMESTDQVKKVIDNLSKGIDDRGEIITFWNPGEFELGCLRPCMHSHQFSILDGTLYLNSTQRSCDVPLGLNFNMVQCAWLLMVVAQISGLKAGKVFHKIVNAHIYEDQLPQVFDHLEREPFHSPTLELHPSIKSLKDLEIWVTTDSFKVHDYKHHPAINYPFSV